jgi:hypothetical protein
MENEYGRKEGDKGTKGMTEREKGVTDEDKKEIIPRLISTGFPHYISNKTYFPQLS